MKKTGQFLFETTLKWEKDSKGTLSSRVITDPITVASPDSFKVKKAGMWTPEHLLISSVSSNFMTTFLFYAKQAGLAISNFECEAIGSVELNKENLKFTSINVYPKIGIEKEEWIDKAKTVIELTKQHSLVAKALGIIIYYHPSIEITAKPPGKKNLTINKKREIYF
jgi:organic hydroperoxide reductase OsmC/OhrA